MAPGARFRRHPGKTIATAQIISMETINRLFIIIVDSLCFSP
jgi:hypothetical protein